MVAPLNNILVVKAEKLVYKMMIQQVKNMIFYKIISRFEIDCDVDSTGFIMPNTM